MANLMDVDDEHPRRKQPSRKRALSLSDVEDADFEAPPHARVQLWPKRTRKEDESRALGLIPVQDALHFDAIGFLQELAFSRLFVTANYTQFNPGRSIVLLYLVRDINEHYEHLW